MARHRGSVNLPATVEYLFISLTLLLWGLEVVEGHGRLLDPAGRSTLWRFGHSTPVNYDDNALYCGGFNRQWGRNRGRCGVCGDPYDGPRQNEAGGKYAKGVIAKHFQKGQEVTVTVELTRSHLGWFEFRLCPVNDPRRKATKSCLDANLLHLADGSTRYQVKSWTKRMHRITVRLPSHVTCSQCVLQWKYNAGNSWGCYGKNTNCCIGCGHQEQFYGCADIAIRGSPTSHTNYNNNGRYQQPSNNNNNGNNNNNNSNNNNNNNNVNSASTLSQLFQRLSWI